MPKIFEKDGFSFFFYMNEHEPVHVHVRKQGKIAKFEIVNGCAASAIRSTSRTWCFTSRATRPALLPAKTSASTAA